MCHNMFHFVDDSFLLSQTFYLLEPSSTTRFFIFFDGGFGGTMTCVNQDKKVLKEALITVEMQKMKRKNGQTGL